MLSEENKILINEYLDVAVNASEDMERFVNLLSDDCVWALMPPGIEIIGKESVEKFVKFAMRSRKHNNAARVEIKNWFTDGQKFCVEYFHAALITVFKIKVIENVCLVCEMNNGKFTKINEYVDTSGSKLIALGLKLFSMIAKIKKIKITKTL